MGELVGVGAILSVGVGDGNSVGKEVGASVGMVVGTASVSSGRISKFEASSTTNVLVFSLYFPVANILLSINFSKSIFSGTSNMIASDEIVTK